MKLLANSMRSSSSLEICSVKVAEIARQTLSEWPLYATTPLLSLTSLAKRLGVGEIWLKYEGCRFDVGSFKTLGAAYVLTLLVKQANTARGGEGIGRNLTVSCASDGNYGTAIAWAARNVGYDSVVYLPSHVTPHREQLIRSFGARTVRIKGNYDAAVSAVKRDSHKRGWLLVSDTSDRHYTTIPRNIMVGYSTMMSEIADSLPLHTITHTFLQCGVGSFAATVCDYLYCLLGDHTPITVTVEPLRAACIFASISRRRFTLVRGTLNTRMAGLACGRPSPLAWEVLHRRADFCSAITDEWAIEAVRTLRGDTRSAYPALFAGETGASGLAALLCAASDERRRRELRLNAGSRILLFCTEGAAAPKAYNKIRTGPNTSIQI